MRTTLLLALVWLSCVAGQAQNNAGRAIPPLNSSGPPSIPSLRYWWVASDLPDGIVSGNWTDRIHSKLLNQATALNQPTNTTNGVHFNGNPIHLTNNPVDFAWATNGAPVRGALWVVLTPTTPAAALGGIVTTDDAGGRGFYATSGNIYQHFAAFGSPTFGSFVNGTTYDVLLNITNANAAATTYFTNGVLAATGTSGNSSTLQKYVGRDANANFFYKGYIREIGFFSDMLTSGQIATLHNYATNLYGYSP